MNDNMTCNYPKDFIGKYPVSKRVRVNELSQLVILEDYFNDDLRFPEISGINLFLLDNFDNYIWQIKAPFGATLSPKTGEWTIHESIIDVFKNGDEWFFMNFHGFVYKIDILTGKSEYKYWTKN